VGSALLGCLPVEVDGERREHLSRPVVEGEGKPAALLLLAADHGLAERLDLRVAAGVLERGTGERREEPGEPLLLLAEEAAHLPVRDAEDRGGPPAGEDRRVEGRASAREEHALARARAGPLDGDDRPPGGDGPGGERAAPSRALARVGL
jgi:hypothetical protein